MRFAVCFLFTAFALFCSTPTAFAWGSRGHHIVAEIAFQFLDDSDKDKIMSYLDGMTIEDASTWLDQVRGDTQYAYTSPWHYVDYPKGASYQPTDQPNIVNALTNTITELTTKPNLTPEQIKFDLFVLIHLVGDLHQPLHVGFPDDKGGNLYQVQYRGKGTNMHRVWDSEIIESQNITLQPCLAMAQHFTPDERYLMLDKVDIPDWVRFSHEMAAIVYPYPYGSNHKIDSNYVVNEVPVIEHQLAVAGVRLAAVLREVAQHLPLAKKGTRHIVDIEVIALESVAKHIGETVTVCGEVYGVKYVTTGSKPTFVNVGAAYPNSPLTLFITNEVREGFSYKPEDALDGKDICIIGKLELYKGKPEIVIKKESDIGITPTSQ